MERKPYPSEMQDRFVLRLPDGLREKVAAAAELADRSMNAEFVRRIEQSFAPDNALPLSDELRKQIEDNAAEYGRTLTEEIVTRLEYSFAWDQAILPASLGKMLSAYRKEHDLDSKESFERLLAAGLHKDAPCVVILNVGGDVDVAQLGAALDKIREKLPGKSAVMVEQYPKLRGKKPASK
jgi:hypothetical protein